MSKAASYLLVRGDARRIPGRTRSWSSTARMSQCRCSTGSMNP